jgi:hypothetical protein
MIVLNEIPVGIGALLEKICFHTHTLFLLCEWLQHPMSALLTYSDLRLQLAHEHLYTPITIVRGPL